MKYELVDCRPVPAKLAPEIEAIKQDAGATLTSCLRTQSAVNYARSRGCTLSSQAELYRDFLEGHGNPANPPGYSTHELRSDGVAFPGVSRGLPLRYWQVGMDWGDGSTAQRVCAAARRRGWIATVTYPSNSRELHHVNFRRMPRLRVFKPLKFGSLGPRVSRLTRALRYLRFHGGPRKGGRYLTHSPGRKFDAAVTAAVKNFQHDHGLKPDGVVGIHTAKQIRVAVRNRKAKEKKR